jgi:hypothetical protein
MRHRLPGFCVAAGLIASAAVASAQTIPRPDHVVIVLMENTASGQLIGSSSAPYINSLVTQGANFTQSFGVTHPSQPNYVALFSGSQQGITDDTCPKNFKGVDNLGAQLIAASLTFGAYSEDLPSDGSTACTSMNYARKHAPWVDFDNVPATAGMIYPTDFPTDFAKLPTLSFVIPNLCDDMHDCSIQTGDSWLKNNIDKYAQWAKTNNSLLILTWDEDDMTAVNQIVTIFVGQMVKPGSYSEKITHYTVLRTLEDMFGLKPLGSAGSATPITDVWTSSGGGGTGGSGGGGSGGGGAGGSGGGGTGGTGGGGGAGGSGGSGGSGPGTGGNGNAANQGGCNVGGSTAVGTSALVLFALFALALRRRQS